MGHQRSLRKFLLEIYKAFLCKKINLLLWHYCGVTDFYLSKGYANKAPKNKQTLQLF